jgi:SAM-dependent methyltransferase
MIFELLKLNIDISDDDFNSIYPDKIKQIARKHWTSVSVAKQSSEFLAERPGTRVLDIGSGAGKFCMIGAVNTRGHFTGIEQRLELVKLSNRLSSDYDIHNIKFVHANITAVRFSEYDSFYFFNSFYENLDVVNKIDNTVRFGIHLYHLYSMYLFEQLARLPLGTRVATYHSPTNIIPSSYRLQDTSCNGFLQFWEKVHND